jgi:hypothetical protein
MPIPANNIDPATLQAALLGYQVELQTIDGRIAEIRRQLGPRASGPAEGVTAAAGSQKRSGR